MTMSEPGIQGQGSASGLVYVATCGTSQVGVAEDLAVLLVALQDVQEAGQDVAVWADNRLVGLLAGDGREVWFCPRPSLTAPVPPHHQGAAATRPAQTLTHLAAARYLGVSKNTLYRLANEGRIRRIKRGRLVRYPIKELERWLEVNTREKRTERPERRK